MFWDAVQEECAQSLPVATRERLRVALAALCEWSLSSPRRFGLAGVMKPTSPLAELALLTWPGDLPPRLV
jgi:hypothetical protein